jgi:hypothetical protein
MHLLTKHRWNEYGHTKLVMVNLYLCHVSVSWQMLHPDQILKRNGRFLHGVETPAAISRLNDDCMDCVKTIDFYNILSGCWG